MTDSIDKEITELKNKIKELEKQKKADEIKKEEDGLTKLWHVKFPEVGDGYIYEPELYQVFGRKKENSGPHEWWEFKKNVTDKWWETSTLGSSVFLERKEAVKKLNKVFKETHDEFMRVVEMMDEINNA